MVTYYLTCANDEEAKRIGRALLEAKLIVCARRSPVTSGYWWNGEIQQDNEVLLMMESTKEKFDEIEMIVTKLHSYEEYVLTQVPVQRTTPGVLEWLDGTLKA